MQVSRDVVMGCNLQVDSNVYIDGVSTFNVGMDGTNEVDPAMIVKDDRIVMNRDVDVQGGRDVKIYGGVTYLYGEMRVNPVQAAIPVLNVTSTSVDINRRFDVTGKTTVKGDAQLNSNLVVKGTTLMTNPLTIRAGGSSNSPVTLEVTQDLTRAETRLEVRDRLEVGGSALFEGSNFGVVISGNGPAAFYLDGDSAVFRRSTEITSNLDVLGSFGVSGDFTVGPDTDVGFVVESDNVRINNRDLILNGNLNVETSDANINGNLRVNPGDVDVLVVDGSNVDIHRPLYVTGDTSISGDLVVDHEGAIGLSVKETGIIIGNDAVVSSNVLVKGNTDLRGTLSVKTVDTAPEVFTADNFLVRTRRDAQLDSNLQVLGRTDLMSPLYVNLGGYVAASVENNKVTVNRGLDVTSNLHVTADSELTGDLIVNPGQFEVLKVNSTRVDVNRNLHVTGDINLTGEVNTISDARVKTNLRPVLGAMEKVNRLRGYFYNRIDTTTDNGSSQYDAEKNKDYLGFVAQEVLDVVPEVVSYDSVRTGMYGVCYANMVALLAEGLKELGAENSAMRARLDRLEKENGCK
jgi:hypothetical protein